MTDTLVRLAGLAGGAVLGVALLAGCGSDDTPTGAEPGTSAAELGASVRSVGAAEWLAGQLEDGLLVGEYGPDPGLSIDAALALAEVPGQEQHLDAVADAVANGLAGYTTGADFGSRDTYAGSVAKAAVLAQVAGEDATSYGGTDLVQRLEELVVDDGPGAGRLADEVVEKDGSDYANVIGQLYAVRALTEAGSGEASAATDFLLKQQCEDGYFRLYFAAPDDADQSCDAGTAEESAPDTDVTALAVLALAEQAGDEEVDGAVSGAVEWLLANQQEDGGFGGATSTEGPNANSTGLAGWALMSQEQPDAAARAAGWLAEVQVTDLPCTDGTELGSETGAVAYDPAALSAGATSGLTEPAARDQWRRGTVQAVPVLALVGDPVSEVEVAHAAAGPVPAGQPVALEVDGLRDGEQACLTGPGRVAEAVTGTGEPTTVEVVAPQRAGAARYVLHRLAAPVTTVVEVGTGS